MRDTDASRSLFYSRPVNVAAELVDAVAHSDECVRLLCQFGVSAAALLDQVEAELSSRRLRCVRVHGSASGELALRDLITQIVGRADRDALRDCDLEAGYVALTEPGEGYDRVVLLVADAHALQTSAVHYVQFACQSGPKLRLVLAGRSSLDATLARDKFTYLRQRVTRTLELPGFTQDPGSTQHEVQNRRSETAEPAPVLAAVHQDRSWSWLTLGALVPMVPLIVLAMAAMGWLHLPAPSTAATSAHTRARDSDLALIRAEVPKPFIDAPTIKPQTVKPVTASQMQSEAAGRQIAETSQHGPEPVPQPAPERAVAAVASLAGTDLVAKQASASLGTVPDAPAAEADTSSATAKDEPPVSVPMEHSVGPSQGARPDVSPALPPVAAQPWHTSATAGPPAPPRSPPRTTAIATATPDSWPAQRPRPGAERAAVPVTALAINSADERHCRDIVLYAQLGKNLSDAEKQFLRDDCHAQ